MSKYSSKELQQIIQQLLSVGHEGDYWDYKREWPPKEENTDLIKDIISFANTTHDMDCFLIFGANDDGSSHPMTMQRRNQNELLNFFASLPWAGNNQPIIAVETISINNIEYDVVIVYNDENTPFYFSTDISPEIKYPASATPTEKKEIDGKKCRKTLRQGVVYTRTGDNTTPFGQIANPMTVEKLWKKRFHLLQPIYNQFIEELKRTSNWISAGENNYHNIFRPEFTFIPDFSDDDRAFREFYVELYPDVNAYRLKYRCQYFGTVLRDVYTVIIDGGRWSTPYPQFELLPTDKHTRFFYMLQDSPDMVILSFLTDKEHYDYQQYEKTFFKYVPLFENKTEKELFEKWLCESATLFSREIEMSQADIRTFSNQKFTNEAVIGKTLVHMLHMFRTTGNSNTRIKN